MSRPASRARPGGPTAPTSIISRRGAGQSPRPAEQIAAYLADHVAVLRVSTLARRLAAISVAHDAKGLPNLAASPLVRATMRGIRRSHGAANTRQSLLREDLFVVLAAMGGRIKDLRDRALLLIGFAGGLRRSELSVINMRTTFERVREGIILTIRRSKTDQDGVGRRIGVPFGRTIHCPVRALQNWLSAARIEDIFFPACRSTRAGLGRSTLRRNRVLDCSRSDGGRRVLPYRVFRPQPARRLRDERDAGGRLDLQDQAADRPCL